MPDTLHNAGDSTRLDATTVVPPNLTRRVYAAGIDIAIVGLCCGALFLSFNPVFGSPYPRIWRPAAIVLALFAVVEIVTGITPGKWLTGLALRTRDGQRPPLWWLVLRGIARLLPVGMFLLTLRISDRMTWMLLLQILIVLIGCYLTICYMTLWRRGSTMFDAIAGTTAVRR
jgi:uncharacterized RDD family membrane protein YckC